MYEIMSAYVLVPVSAWVFSESFKVISILPQHNAAATTSTPHGSPCCHHSVYRWEVTPMTKTQILLSYFFIYFISLILYSIEWCCDYCVWNGTNLEGNGHDLIKVLSWNLHRRLRKTISNLSQDCWCSGQVSNRKLPVFKSRMLPLH